jgi:hypothetical protein
VISRALRSALLPCWLLPSLLLASCAAFVSKQEYADYRAVRLERDEGTRLVAMQRYVSEHPQGHWYNELQVERRARDQAVFEAGRATRRGLELYLQAFPDGLFVAQARSRLAAVDLIEQRQRQDAERAAQLAETRKRAEAERNRTWVTRFVGYWTKTLLGVSEWGAPIEQVARGNPDFSRAFGRPPRPRCSAEECVKYYDSPYGVPVPGGTRLERTMRLLLRLRLDQARLVRAELLLPSWGFSRWIEVEERRPVVDADPLSRAAAVQAVLGRMLPLLDQLAGERETIEGYTLAEIAPPAIGPSGELVDTTVEDPSAPANRIQGQAASGEDASPSVEQMLKPQAPEAAADMEMAPLQVGPDGRPLTPASEMVVDPLVVPPSGAASGEMVLDPLAVPKPGQGAAPAPGGIAAPGATGAGAVQTVEPGLTRAFRYGNLRIVLHAAATNAKAPAYDALIIESIAPPGTGAKRPRAGAAAATPAATPKAKAGDKAKPAAAPVPAAAPPAAAPAPAAPNPAGH